MGLFVDGVEGLNRTIGMAMGTFWALLILALPAWVMTLTLADLCHYDDPVDIVNRNFVSARNITFTGSNNLTSLNMVDVASYFSTCNGTNPIGGYFEQAHNTTKYLTAEVQSVLRYNETLYYAPPSCTDNSCITCPNHYILRELYNLTVQTSDSLDLLQDSFDCSPIMLSYREAIESTVCTDIYDGTASLAVSTFFSSFFCSCVCVYCWSLDNTICG